jgi:hypothetical protein
MSIGTDLAVFRSRASQSPAPSSPDRKFRHRKTPAIERQDLRSSRSLVPQAQSRGAMPYHPYRIPKATGIGFSNDRGVLMMEGLTGPQAPGTGGSATDILRIARWRHGRQCRLRCLDRETQIGARNIPRDQPIIFTVSPSPLHSPDTKPAWRCRRKPIAISFAVLPPLMRTRA